MKKNKNPQCLKPLMQMKDVIKTKKALIQVLIVNKGTHPSVIMILFLKVVFSKKNTGLLTHYFLNSK